MKKIISKILIIFIIMIILFEFSFSSNVSYAFDSEDINSITNLIGGLVSFVLWIPRLLVIGISWLMGSLLTVTLAESCGISTDAIFAGTQGDCATPFDIFFNKYTFLDVDFFDLSTGDGMINIVRLRVAQWFYILRTISAAVLLVILIYVGIRMAISTIAEDKAKYKKMFWDWGCSLALIFVLQYIAIFTIEANKVIVNFLRNYGYNDIDKAINDIMWQAAGPMGIGSLVSTFVYCMIIFQTIAFMLIYIKRMIKVGFLIIISPMISITYSIDKMGDGKAQALNKWLKEFVYTILIQPFHCIMYLAFVNTAMKLLSTGATVSDVVDEGLWEAVGNMNQLANGFLAILCLKFINDGEKAIRKIFNFQDDGNMTSLAAGAAMSMAAIQGAQKIGQTTSKGITMAKNMRTKFKGALAKDGEKGGPFSKIQDSLNNAKDSFNQTAFGKAANAIGTGLDKAGKKVGEWANSTGEAIGKTGVGKFGKAAFAKGQFIGGKIANAGRFVGGKARVLKGKADLYKDNFSQKHKRLSKAITGAKTLGSNALTYGSKAFKKSLPVAMGMMGMAMSYSTGSSGALEAIGAGSGMMKGTEEFLATAQGTIEENVNMGEDVQADPEIEKELATNTEQMNETNDSLKETNKSIKNLTGTDAEAYSLLEEEERIKQKKARLEEDSKTPGGISADRYKKQMEELEKREKEIAKRKSEISKSNPSSLDKANNLFTKKRDLQAQLKAQTTAREDIKSRLQSSKKAAALDKIAEYRNNGGAAQIASARAEITKAIQKCMLERKYQDSQGDVTADYTLSDKETRSAERMQESICALLDRAVVAGGASLDAGQVFKRFFGTESDSAMSKSLEQAIDAYQFQARAKNYNDNEALYTSSGGTKEKFEDDISTKAAKHG